jgi:hypothetical protein
MTAIRSKRSITKLHDTFNVSFAFVLIVLWRLTTQAWDDRGSTLLSAVTAGIRSSWMSAIRKAANLPDPDSNVDSLAVCPDAQQEPNPQSPTT